MNSYASCSSVFLLLFIYVYVFIKVHIPELYSIFSRPHYRLQSPEECMLKFSNTAGTTVILDAENSIASETPEELWPATPHLVIRREQE